jgi:Putative lumazine-binding
MKRFALGFGLVALLALNFAHASQQQKTSDETAIRATITDYIEGYYTGDAGRMERSLHPHYLKHTISESDGHLRYDGEDWLADGPGCPAERSF